MKSIERCRKMVRHKQQRPEKGIVRTSEGERPAMKRQGIVSFFVLSPKASALGKAEQNDANLASELG